MSGFASGVTLSRSDANAGANELASASRFLHSHSGLFLSVSDDAELLQRIRNGAADEFAELIRRHQSHVYAILYRYERDHQRLEDLAQETFIKAWRGLEQFDGRAPFQHWLSRIAVHVALDHLRKHKRARNEVGFPDLGDEALEWLRSDDRDRALEAAQAREILDAAMRELSPADQLIITLLEIEERSVKEICSLTGLSSVAVRVRALRARAKLKKAVEELAGAEKPGKSREQGTVGPSEQK